MILPTTVDTPIGRQLNASTSFFRFPQIECQRASSGPLGDRKLTNQAWSAQAVCADAVIVLTRPCLSDRGAGPAAHVFTG